MNSSCWECAQRAERKIWEDDPSPLSLAMKQYAVGAGLRAAGKTLLDLGCGCGRASFFPASEPDLRVTGVDSSQEAVDLARSDSAGDGRRKVEFRRARFQELDGQKSNLVFSANLYPILRRDELAGVCLRIKYLLARDGLFFPSTHSIRDPELAGKRADVPRDEKYFEKKSLMHLGSRERLKREFSLPEFRKLSEREFLEPGTGGETHQYIVWILVAAVKG
jgi:cyclopropane fatty-acyl-phospholipid synthase-like methyltransferase